MAVISRPLGYSSHPPMIRFAYNFLALIKHLVWGENKNTCRSFKLCIVNYDNLFNDCLFIDKNNKQSQTKLNFINFKFCAKKLATIDLRMQCPLFEPKSE